MYSACPSGVLKGDAGLDTGTSDMTALQVRHAAGLVLDLAQSCPMMGAVRPPLGYPARPRVRAMTPAPRWAVAVKHVTAWLTEDCLGGPRPWKLAWVID